MNTHEEKKSVWSEMAEPFKNLFTTSTAHKVINVGYFIEGLVYFGMLTLMAMYFNNYVALDDVQAGRMVGFLTAGITLSMIFLGAVVDLMGIRKTLICAFLFLAAGRFVMCLAPVAGHGRGIGGDIHIWAMMGMLGIIIGYGMYQPACYAAIKNFTTKAKAPMGYAMLYALMNLGSFLAGILSPPVRMMGDARQPGSGILLVYWVYVFLTVLALLIVVIFLTAKAVKAAQVAPELQEENSENPLDNMTLKEKMAYYFRNFPFRDMRFLFFIFILIPVQTLFAHNWLTIPQYCERAFQGGVVSNNFEFFSNINPLLIFVLTPVIASLTARYDVYKMMVVGTFVMALPAFFLALGPSIYALMAYLVLMTVGEAIWQPRFLQLVADIAPRGMVGIYMGIGQFPWFLTKVVTSLYSGWFLMHYCPAGVPAEQLNTQFMWFVYALIACISPVGLVLAAKWMQKGFITEAK